MPGSPKYKSPPVVETVIGVQFPELKGFRAVHFGRYGETLGSRYPKAEDHARLDPVSEERFPRRRVLLGPQFQLMQGAPLNRTWFTAPSETELIQLQPDRFLFNWRNRGGEYPSFEANSTIFFEEFKKFCKFCESQENLADPKPEICEVTYVNHIVPEEGEAAIELAGRVFNGLRWKAAEGFLPSPESVTFNRAYVIRNQSRQAGRLYVESSLAVRRDGSEFREFILLKLTARVNHEPDKEQNLRDSVQLAHDWVVRGFADLMDDQIQKERWGRQE